MRPGPGLVVMALAFISGARRGSSTSQTLTTIPTATVTATTIVTQQQQQKQKYYQHQRQANIDEENQQKHQQQQQQEQSYTILPNFYYNSNNYHNSINHNYFDNFKLGKIGHEDDDDYGEGTSALTRVNPWLSACDLAQPNQAPDLQGQCSAGTLPVAWVDEGPGPPKCPKSCEQIRLENSYVTSNKYYSNLINNNINKRNNNNYYNHYMNNNNFNTMENINYNVKQQQQQQHKIQEQQINNNNNNNLKEDISSYLFNQQMQQKTQQQHQNFQKNQQPQQKIQEQQQQPQKQRQKRQQQQQQCLDYLGDNEESSPVQLCKKSRVELATKLRSLRLKHCCERNVFSALHTLALNSTLNGGIECIRTLNDIMDMDALATRITCEYTEILFRYDCRQIYSLIHHCEDCKEAYRRWVCSTLIPYFAEPEDIRQNSTTSNTINKTENHSSITSNRYHSSNNNNIKNNNNNNNINNNNNNNNSNNNNNNNNYNNNNNNNNNSNNNNINNNNNNNSNNNNINNNNNKNNVVRSSRSVKDDGKISSPSAPSEEERETESTTAKTIENHIVINSLNNENDNKNNLNYNRNEQKLNGTSDVSQFISTAIEDSIVKDPVIERLLKRSKRKIELRRRRRIRPCLSVCQTVEQKCPYMLPGDRAPAYPTQYAGEPTFLCLDPNIPETGEQLSKSNSGPENCCYRYCGDSIDGICAYCDDLISSSSNRLNENSTTPSPVTLSSQTSLSSSSPGTSSPSSSSSLFSSTTLPPNDLSNNDLIMKKTIRIKLDNNVYLYDFYDDIPSVPIANCQNFPTTTPTSSNRCTIPYYASSSNTIFKNIFVLFKRNYLLIVWTILWCLVNNFILITINNWTKSLLLLLLPLSFKTYSDIKL